VRETSLQLNLPEAAIRVRCTHCVGYDVALDARRGRCLLRGPRGPRSPGFLSDRVGEKENVGLAGGIEILHSRIRLSTLEIMAVMFQERLRGAIA
jgi:hypothetical protein